MITRLIWFISVPVYLITATSVKRDSDGNVKYIRTTHESHLGSDSGISIYEWTDGVNFLTRFPGPKFPLVQTLPNANLSHELLMLGKLELEAFEFMVNHSEVTRDVMVELLNQNIDSSRTVDAKPFTNARVYVWYRLVLETDNLVLRNGDSVPSVAEFIQDNTRISTNDRGVGFLELSPIAWDAIVYPRLLWSVPRHFVPTAWSILVMNQYSTVKNHREFSHVPFIIREFVHRNFFVNAPLKLMNHILAFDSHGELLITMSEYFASLNSLVSMDYAIYRKFFKENDHARCDDPETLALEWNGLFNTTNRQLFKLPYSSDRVVFWCNEASKISERNNFHEVAGFFEIVKVVSGNPYLRLNRTGLELSLFRSLVEPLLVPEKISVDDVLIAWETRDSSTPIV